MIRPRGGKTGEVFRHAGGFVKNPPEGRFMAVEVPDNGLQGVLKRACWGGGCQRVTGEARLAENQKKGNSHDRQNHEHPRPCDGGLGSAGNEDGTHGQGDAQNLQQNCDCGVDWIEKRHGLRKKNS